MQTVNFPAKVTAFHKIQSSSRPAHCNGSEELTFQENLSPPSSGLLTCFVIFSFFDREGGGETFSEILFLILKAVVMMCSLKQLQWKRYSGVSIDTATSHFVFATCLVY
jgi:hypothetical protein